MIRKNSKIYVAGHRGLVGSALMRQLRENGYTNLLSRTHAELDLIRPDAVDAFFAAEKPDYVILAAAKVGGILANNQYPADFIRENLAIQQNVLTAAQQSGIQDMIFLGSSCIYPRDCLQPMHESHLLTGPLELTNRPYALAKIAGIDMCWAMNRQYGTRYLSLMPTNMYGPGDNYDLQHSHVLPALIRKMHEAKITGQEAVTVWGSGTPKREFLYSEDLARACVHLMELPAEKLEPLLADPTQPPLINIGFGKDVTIRELVEQVAEAVGFTGQILWDASKPDGTPRKLLDTSRLSALGWEASISLHDGLRLAYAAFLEEHGQTQAPAARRLHG